MSYETQKSLEDTYVMHTYARKPVEFVRGAGTRLYDSTGKEYLDFLAGIGVVNLGHADPAVAVALSAQAEKLTQASNYYYAEGRGELARTISDLLNNEPESSRTWKCFFANSGAEANESAFKLARKYGKKHLGGAATVVSLTQSFHGRTLATTAATAQEAKQISFTPLPECFAHAEANDLHELMMTLAACSRAARTHNRNELMPVAVVLEVVQGESGVWPLDLEFIQKLRTLTAGQGILLIVDEVQTGFYRTGLPFAFQHADIAPDIVTMAKGIANGFPLGVCAARGMAANILEPGEHGSTFGGNPLAVTAATATIAALKARELGNNAIAVGAYLRQQLAALPLVTEVRGLGLMLGVSLSQEVAPQVVDAALEQGLVLNSIGADIIRFLPPLCVSEAEVDSMITLLGGLLKEYS